MAISGVSGATPPAPPVNTQNQQVKARQDSDGDNDGSRSGEVEKAEPQSKVSSSSTLGSVINTKA